ncbi:tectonin beta-propeller repeat-containing protein 1-like isoform X2 [Gigantopelta aegis]|uniref:tectonin beta-propeller repeat-containing protein 1-like isoform X2 n=1 Tax=Gigantopelta aegis TaxID=1735272 RepID=UPI001B88AC9C|nr:tectonin beta-propeller repeat-containing protein 1-like isoform X2 [Gigantopelta aegis]
MGDSCLWLANTNGNVFTISTRQQCLRQLVKTYRDGVKLKCIAAHCNGAWGIGHDHNVYVFVQSSDVPIRVQETTYENQRWAPLRGFHRSHLLPTDRGGWSDDVGDGDQPRECFQLPSEHWEWEGDWTIDNNFQGEVIPDPEGWMYATNFPGPWLLQSKWKSCVRRRKWIRFRRYTSTDVWALVSDTAVKDSGECFIQIAVGGFDMPKQPPGHLSVWAISITGDIYVRTNVTRDCPEGEDWQRLNTDTLGAVDISVGPTGQVWTVTWDGLAIVRLGINSEHVYGTDWVTVSYPDKDTRLMQLALGLNSLWVLSREGKVWFRKGISGGDLSSGNLSSVTGTVWIEMVGEMSYITITPNDHVFAIGMDDQEVYYRAGVTNSDLGGKSWQKLQLQEDIRGISTGSTSSCMSEMRNDSDLDESDCCCSDSVSVNSEVRSTPICDVVPVFSVVKSEMDGNEQPMQHGGIKTFSLPVLSAVSKECDFQVSPSEKNKGDISSVGTCGDITDGNFHVTLNNTGDINPGDAKVDSVMQTDDKIGNILKQSDDLFQDGEGVDNHCLSTPDVNESYEVKNESLTLPDNDKLKLTTKDRSTSQSLVNDSDSNMWSPRSSEIFNFVTDLLNSEPNETNHDAPDSSDRMCPDKIQKITNSGKCSTSLTQGIQCSNNIPNNKMAATHRTPYSDAIPNDKKPNSGNPWTDVISNDKKTTSSSSHDNQAASIGWVSLLPSEAYTGTITDNCETSMSKNQSSCRPKSLQSNEGRDGTAAVPEETLMSDHSVVEMFVLTPAMPRYCWMQLSGLACTINNPTKVYWLQPRKESESGKDLKSKISVAIRQQILKLLQERNLKETENFQYYESAIDKSSWVKKASMQWFHFGRHAGWLPCTVELEVALKEGDTGLLTVHYKHRRKEMDVQILIQDIVCVYRVSTANQSTVFAVHTADTVKIIRPYLLSPSSEVEANDWVSVICGANASLWNLRSAIPVGSVWSTTLRGDTYIHRPPTCHVKANEMCWIPVGGHLEYIETSPCGVTWALGYNHTVWFYSGGYGGGVFKEQSGVSKDVHLQTDVRMMSVFENQRWYPLVGYFGCGLLRETYNDGARHREQNKEDVKLPSSLWQWDGDWCIDYNAQGGVDNEGWQYAVNFRHAFHVRKGLTDRARRRRWVRKCKLETLGPWLQVGQTKLSDISIQVDQPSSPSDPLVVWAVGTRGNLLCRIGITREKPQGESWVHIPTDHLFHTVSVGGAYRVWAVAKDGSAWYRTGVSPNNPQGSNWLQVVFPPETGAALSRISAGGTAVWVVDRNGALWYRKDITATFPEGTSWVQICDKVLDVSVGLSNQVWIVANANFSRNKYSRGVVYRRVGISEHSPAGTSWEIIIGSGWNHVSVRGQIEKYKSDML